MASFLGCYLALCFSQITGFLVYVENGAEDQSSPSHSLEDGILQSNECNMRGRPGPQPQWLGLYPSWNSRLGGSQWRPASALASLWVLPLGVVRAVRSPLPNPMSAPAETKHHKKCVSPPLVLPRPSSRAAYLAAAPSSWYIAVRGSGGYGFTSTRDRTQGGRQGFPEMMGEMRDMGKPCFVFFFHNKKHHDQPVKAFLAWYASPTSGNSMEGKGRGPFMDLRSNKMASTLCPWIDSSFC